jgi:hypothetical protein
MAACRDAGPAVARPGRRPRTRCLEAFAAALARWPEQGIPDSPEAWLLTVARRELLRARVTRVSRTIQPWYCWRWATTRPPPRCISPTRD